MREEGVFLPVIAKIEKPQAVENLDEIIDALSYHLLSAHLLQNVVLAEWAPALLVLGLPPGLAAAIGGIPAIRLLTRPPVALGLWLATYFVWHLPALYDTALEHYARQLERYLEGDIPIIVRGDGCYLEDSNGKRYLDALAGLFSVNIGYGFGEEIGQAALEQMRELPFYTNWSYAHPRAIELAAAVAELAPGDLVLFPSYLLHAVPPNQGERRITLSFNAIPGALDSWGYGIKFSA
jgi:hypothetical protein